MGFLAPEQQRWIIAPLVDAGLDVEQITGLVFRLGFEAVVGEGRVGDLGELVRDLPPEAQAAWLQAVGRMLGVQEPGLV